MPIQGPSTISYHCILTAAFARLNMARLRFPGRPGQRFGRSLIRFMPEEARNCRNRFFNLTANIQKNLRGFYDLFGDSDEVCFQLLALTFYFVYITRIMPCTTKNINGTSWNFDSRMFYIWREPVINGLWYLKYVWWLFCAIMIQSKQDFSGQFSTQTNHDHDSHDSVHNVSVNE